MAYSLNDIDTKILVSDNYWWLCNILFETSVNLYSANIAKNP